MEKVKDDAAAGSGSLPRPATFGAPTISAAPATMAPPVAPVVVPSVSATAPAPAPVVPVDPTQVLDDLVGRVEGVHAALLASVDGFGIAHSATMADEPANPAMLAAAVGLAHQLAAMGDGETLRQLVVEHDRGLVVVWPTGRARVLAVLASTSVDQRTLRAAVRDRAAVLSGGGR
jgi:predicted regulator of Ras-like GTPase activity (Roadblock/LC7/MglB family)